MQKLQMQLGGTIVGPDAVIRSRSKRAERKLGPPANPSREDMLLGPKAVIDGRLTLTYRDVYGAKHATVLDYSSLQRWEDGVYIPDVEKDLVDLEAAARARPTTGDTSTL